jgi:hypothetical protein
MPGNITYERQLLTLQIYSIKFYICECRPPSIEQTLRMFSICIGSATKLRSNIFLGLVGVQKLRDNFMGFSSCETQCKHYPFYCFRCIFYDDNKADEKHLDNHHQHYMNMESGVQSERGERKSHCHKWLR